MISSTRTHNDEENTIEYWILISIQRLTIVLLVFTCEWCGLGLTAAASLPCDCLTLNAVAYVL